MKKSGLRVTPRVDYQILKKGKQINKTAPNHLPLLLKKKCKTKENLVFKDVT